jgi:hypothetical protein
MMTITCHDDVLAVSGRHGTFVLCYINSSNLFYPGLPQPLASQDFDSEYEAGYAEDCDGDVMLCFEKAADLLTPDLPLEKIMESIKHIPAPVHINPEL